MRDRTKLKVFGLADRLAISVYRTLPYFQLPNGLAYSPKCDVARPLNEQCTTTAKALNALMRALRKRN